MGIKGFYNKWFINRRNKQDKTYFGNLPGIVSKETPPLVSSIFFDLNALIHNAAGKVYCYPEPDRKKTKEFQEFKKREEINSKKNLEELEIEHHREVCMMIYEHIKMFNPQDYVVLAVDGVAPMAKITQQRSRRYKKMLDSSPPPTGDVPLKNRFDSNSITPGTDFMFRLDVSIQLFLRDAVRDAHFETKHIIYSSHLTPGEGEHKIFDVLRRKDNGVVPGIGVNIVVGADADLFMLSLLCKTPYLLIYREADEEKVFIDIDSLRVKLYEKMTAFGVLEIPVNIVIQDFVLIFFTIGNDFLPNILSFDDVKSSINTSFISYTTLGLPLTDENGQILWENYVKFIGKIAKKEQVLLENIVKNVQYSEPHKSLVDATTRIFNAENVIEGTFSEDVAGGKESVSYKVDMKKLGENWYKKVFEPRHPDATNLLKKFNATELISKSKIKENIDEMCLEYFKGMQWIMRYYLFGHNAVTSRFIYVYHYAPLVQDMASAMERFIAQASGSLPTVESIANHIDDPIITPIHQLLMVQPNSSWDLIPGKFRFLLFDPLRDISPMSFMVDAEGRKGKKGEKSYTDIALLSIVDPRRVIDEATRFPIPAKYGIVKTKFVLNAYYKKIPFIPMNLKELRRFQEKQANSGGFVNRVEKDKPKSRDIVVDMIEDAVEEAIEESVTDIVTLPKYTKPEKQGVILLGWNARYVM
jgi:5'-3' exonuclease